MIILIETTRLITGMLQSFITTNTATKVNFIYREIKCIFCAND